MDRCDDLKDIIYKIEAKLEKLDEKLDNINLRHERNTVILDEHQRRSIANEKNVELLKQELEQRIKPFESSADKVSGVFKLVGVISVLVGIGSGLMKMFEFFKK